MDDWKGLIENLNNEGTIPDTDGSGKPNYRIFYESDVDTEGTDEYKINNHADLKDEYYKSIQTELENQLESNNASLDDITNQDKLKAIWPAIIWNESMAQLIAEFWYYYKKSENDFIVEKEDGTIDDYFTKGIITAAGANVSFRKSDIRNADAGYFFGREKATYEECYYFGDRSGEDWILTLESSYKDDGNQEKTGTKTYTLTDVVFKASQTTFVEKLLNGDFSTAADWIDDLLQIKEEREEENKEDNKWYGIIIEGKTDGDYDKNHISSFTLIKVKKAEAEGEENTIVKVVPEIVKVTLNPWVLPWYNFDADTYSKVRGNDKHYSVLANEDYLQKTREQGHNKNKSDSSYEWLRLLMPEYKRRVEVEDLNRNFWVIGQTLAAISAYLFDDDSPISKLIQGILNEILQLWENVLLLWAAIGTQKVRNYDKTHCEVVYLTNNDFQPYLKYDGFENQLSGMNLGSLCNLISNKINYLKYQYNDYNLAIIPSVRFNNYEHNYYSQIWYPGIWILDRNSEKKDWQIFHFTTINTNKDSSWGSGNPTLLEEKGILNEEDQNNGILINLENFSDSIYAIKEEEENYLYMRPLEKVQTYRGKEALRYYGLSREVINFNYDVKEQSGSFSLSYFDEGEQLVTSNPKFDLIEIQNLNIKELSDDDLIELSPKFNHRDLVFLTGTASISQGYYQGEMLSSYGDTQKRVYNIVLLSPASLKPTFDSESILVSQYASGSRYEQYRKDDGDVLQSIIKHTFEYYDLENKNDFWTEEKEALFDSKNYQYYDGEYQQNSIPSSDGQNNEHYSFNKTTTRASAPQSWYNVLVQEFFVPYYSSIDDWKKDAINRFKNDKMNDDSILFIEGQRDYNWHNTAETGYPSQYCRLYYPNSENEKTNGFPFPLLAFYRGRGESATGSALGFKNNIGEVITSYYSNYSKISNASIQDLHNPFVTCKYDTPSNSSSSKRCRYKIEGNKHIPYDYKGEVIMNTPVNEIVTSAGATTTIEEQALIMRKKGDKEIEEDNWRVVIIRQNQPTTHIYENNTPSNWEDYYMKLENLSPTQVYEGIIRRVAYDLCEEYRNNNNKYPNVETLGTLLYKYFDDIKDENDEVKKYFMEQDNKPLYTDTTEDREGSINQFRYDQAILQGKYPVLFKEWSDLSHDQNQSNRVKKIKNIWKKLNDTECPTWTLSRYRDAAGQVINNSVFLSGKIGNTIGVYVFAPNSVHARGAYRRDSNRTFYFDESDNPNLNNTIASLRSGYEVISNNVPQRNYEKYKSMTNAFTDNPSYLGSDKGKGTDLNYSIEWNADIIEFE